MNKFNASAALCLVFDDDEAGQASYDELSDEVEISDDDLFVDNIDYDQSSKTGQRYLQIAESSASMAIEDCDLNQFILEPQISSPDTFKCIGSKQSSINLDVQNLKLKFNPAAPLNPLLSNSFYQKSNSTEENSSQKKVTVVEKFYKK